VAAPGREGAFLAKVADLTGDELSEIIERAVERGVARALAAARDGGRG
jgi:hypothetical protein